MSGAHTHRSVKCTYTLKCQVHRHFLRYSYLHHSRLLVIFLTGLTLRLSRLHAYFKIILGFAVPVLWKFQYRHFWLQALRLTTLIFRFPTSFSDSIFDKNHQIFSPPGAAKRFGGAEVTPSTLICWRGDALFSDLCRGTLMNLLGR